MSWEAGVADAMLQGLFEVIRRSTGAERGVLLWRDGKAWQPCAGYAPDGAWFGAGPAACRPVPALLLDLARRPTARVLRDSVPHGVTAAVALPLRRADASLGCLYLEVSGEPAPMVDTEMPTLERLAAEFALVIDAAARWKAGGTPLQTAFEEVPAQIAIKDLEGRYLLHNDRVAQVLATSGESLLGRSSYEMHDAGHAELWRAEDARVIEEDRVIMSLDRLELSDGCHTYRRHRFPVRDEHGRTCALGACVVDVSGLEPDRADPFARHAPAMRGKHVLLVEDNALNQELAREVLWQVGLVVDVAEDGRDALDHLERSRYDVVLMDCQMPVMDGYAATREIRRRDAWRTLPVIAMTGDARHADRDEALAAGMNDHIAKPIDIPEMFETLARWLQPPPRLD